MLPIENVYFVVILIYKRKRLSLLPVQTYQKRPMLFTINITLATNACSLQKLIWSVKWRGRNKKGRAVKRLNLLLEEHKLESLLLLQKSTFLFQVKNSPFLWTYWMKIGLLRKFSFAVLQFINLWCLLCKEVIILQFMVDSYELQVFLLQLMLWRGMVGRIRNQSGIRSLSMHNIYVCFL